MRNYRNKVKPPAFAGFIIKRLTLYRDKYIMSDDLVEEYEYTYSEKGRTSANIWYWRQCFYALKFYLFMIIPRSFMMLKNYIKIAFRNFIRHKSYSIINVIGLSIGFATFITIMTYVKYELSYDSFFENSDSLYRIHTTSHIDNVTYRLASSTRAVGPSMKKDFPEVQEFGRLYRIGESSVSFGENVFVEKNIFCADTSFLKIFGFEIIRGDSENILAAPRQVILSESAAEKYFGNSNPIGKTILLRGSVGYQVTGIFRNIQVNCHFNIDILISIQNVLSYYSSTDPANDRNGWNKNNFHTYVLLDRNADSKKLEEKLRPFLEKYQGAELRDTGRRKELTLMPITDIHLKSNRMAELDTGSGDYKTIYILTIIAFFILGIAWINYINLSTARAMVRSKEVGVRKVIGAQKSELVKQFLLESFIFNAAGLILAMVLVLLLYPYYSSFLNIDLDGSQAGLKDLVLTVAGFFTAGILISGFYPALVLSSFKPAYIVKGKLGSSVHGRFLRKFLVVFQFTLSAFLITGTLVIINQVSYMRDHELGLNIDRVMVVEAPTNTADLTGQDVTAFRESLLQNPGISRLAISNIIPGRHVSSAGDRIQIIGRPDNPQATHRVRIDRGFLDLYQIRILSGKNFSEDHTPDNNALLINESTLKLLNISNPDDAVGLPVVFEGERSTIIGVAADHNQYSLKELPLPLVYSLTGWGDVSVKLNTTDPASTIEFIEGKYRQFFPGNPFNYYFVDEEFDRLYGSEIRLGRISGIFASIAVFVAGLGLFGLSSFSFTTRMKEICVRKVLGASDSVLMGAFSRGFLQSVIMANIIAGPVSFFLMNRWLREFAYRIEIGLDLILFSVMVTLVVAVLTIAVHSAKVIMTDPAATLRYE